jgi:dolichol-phosphate mannosyltransferase
LFIEKWLEGYEVVYAIRTKRKENFLLRFMFASFYTILGKMANFRLPKNAGNFSLMDRSVIEHLLKLGERNRYLPGLRAWVGYRQTGIPVERRARYDKSARVGFRAKWTLAMNAFFSFSYVPIFVFRALGLISIFLAIVIFMITLVTGLVDGTALEGMASPIIWIAFFAGINLFGIGVVGEYVARIYDEVKARPQYIVESIRKRK